MATNVLVVDDDEVFRERLARALRVRGAQVVTAPDAVTAERRLGQGPKLSGAVVDLKMPGPSGLAVVAAVRAHAPGARIVVLTGYASLSTAMEAGRLGADEYLTKPAHADAVWAALQGAAAAAAGAGAAEAEVPTPSLAGVEWLHIQQVLDDCGGNRSEAARRLGLHRRTLQRKLQKFPPGE
jgi:two-component system response regulator RegA